ncbi:MAG: endonuclease III [Desulfobacterota bacterium]|nr:endonuclease III [Thermodesulfobacteriota bacterium]MDW8002038.1 endonuclease III [Deltaproteobacteria bacterium]
MKKGLTFKKVFEKLSPLFPDAMNEENNSDPFFVLISTILSHRTKDEVTEEAIKRVKERIKGPQDLLAIPQKELESLIFPVGFYKNKARILKDIAQTIVNVLGGRVPDTFEELLKLKGVGHKTANLVLSRAFGKPAICVDTHVHRISNRMGLVRTKTPQETEIELKEKMPKKYWKNYNGLLVAFGKNLCKPISPLCSKCPLYKECPRIGVVRWR